MKSRSLYLVTKLSETLSSAGNGLLGSDGPQEPILERQEDVKELVADKRNQDVKGGHQGVHEVMVCRCDNGGKN